MVPRAGIFPAELTALRGAGLLMAVLLVLYATYALVLGLVLFDEPEAIFSPWTVVYGVPQFTVWALGLFLATRSYAARTAARP